MSAALSTAQSTPSMRPLSAVFGGIVVAAAIVGLVAFGQQATAKPQAPSVAAGAPVLHDRGLATAPSVAAGAPVLHDRGLATAPSVASVDSPSRSSGGSNGTRFRQ